MNNLSPKMLKRIKKFQDDEMTGYVLYKKIAEKEKNESNRKILEQIAEDEKNHAKTWEKYTGKKSKPSRVKIFIYSLFTIIFGYSFSIRLLERTEEFGIREYEKISEVLPEAVEILKQEHEHEEMLLELLDEERLKYVGAIVLGLNDALVELTGALVGITFALRDTKIVALSGIITGISATLSMAASNYLAEKAEGNKNALKSSIYTGVAYLVTVVLMVLPYLLFPSHMYVQAFITMIVIVVLIIMFFNFYISVAKNQLFLKNFATMTIISLGVAVISFVIGIVAKNLLGLDV